METATRLQLDFAGEKKLKFGWYDSPGCRTIMPHKTTRFWFFHSVFSSEKRMAMAATEASIHLFPCQHPEHWGCRSAGVSPSTITQYLKEHTQVQGEHWTSQRQISEPRFGHHYIPDTFLPFQMRQATQPYFHIRFRGNETTLQSWWPVSFYIPQQGGISFHRLFVWGSVVPKSRTHALMRARGGCSWHELNRHRWGRQLSLLWNLAFLFGLGYQSFWLMSGCHLSKKPKRPRERGRVNNLFLAVQSDLLVQL